MIDKLESIVKMYDSMPQGVIDGSVSSVEMLTVEFLKAETNRGKVFAIGTTTEPRLHSEPVKWVAKVGDGFHDWAIYYHLANTDTEYIKTNGEKVVSEDIISKLVHCTPEALAFYRH